MIDITGVSDVDTNILEAGLSGLGINKYKGKQIDDLVKYYKMVVSANSSFNLTAITEWNDFVTRHFIDSLALVRTGINLNNDLKIIDIGTGAGFPGIPLKIMYPELQVTLLDSLKKRVSFLEEVVDSLKLEVVSCFHGRAEDYGRDEKFRERYSLCVSRAVAKYLILLEYSLPFLEVGGCFIGYKSGEYEQEVSEAKKPAEILGGGEIAVQKIVLPGSDIERTFVMTGKIGETPEKYPRRSAKIKRGVFS